MSHKREAAHTRLFCLGEKDMRAPLHCAYSSAPTALCLGMYDSAMEGTNDTSADKVVEDIASMSFEEAMEELEAIIEHIERGEIGLEESLIQRRRGDALVKRCRAVLDAAEQEIQQIKPAEE